MMDNHVFADYPDDEAPWEDSSTCQVCGTALIDDLSDFVERLCFACAHPPDPEPPPWTHRLSGLWFQFRHWPTRVRVRRDLAHRGLPF